MANRRAQPPVESKQGAPPVSPWRASRERAREREIKREAVIRAAVHAFNRKGYHNTSLDDIAAALDVTKPTVYYYVTSKEQLLFEWRSPRSLVVAWCAPRIRTFLRR
jgi:AcrR family transcriptional regulator